MNFNIVNREDTLYSKVNYYKVRNMSILDFQFKLLDLVRSDSTPIMEKLNFIKIIISNIEEFISIRYSKSTNSELIVLTNTLESLYKDIGKLIISINSLLNYTDTYSESMYKIIKCGKSSFVYTGEDDIIMEGIVEDNIDANVQCRVGLVYGDVNSDFIDYFIHVPREILRIDYYCDYYNKSLKECRDLWYPEEDIYYEKINYYEELLNRDILLRVPYDSYQMILDFIDEMCTNENITTVFITLYRTAKNSEIIKSLLKARANNKNVIVYVEPTARGDEQQNLDTINLLRDNDINIVTTLLNYKVHSKIFCAVDKDFNKYIHIGTGNYNEKTSAIYTDTHILTCNKLDGVDVLKSFIGLMSKSTNLSKDYYSNTNTSPFNSRETINDMIDNETSKCENGRIFIKCNNLCDKEVINKLYYAASKGVKVDILCRTGCSLFSRKNITVRSKVGRYLEHDRVYIFGDRVFISSADLLLRNLSKRFEMLFEISDHTCKTKLINAMNEIWNDPFIHILNKDNKWKLKS